MYERIAGLNSKNNNNNNNNLDGWDKLIGKL